MFMSKVLAAALLTGVSAAHADVTVSTQTTGKATFMDVDGSGVMHIKGKRQRNERVLGSRALTLIFDVDGARIVSLDDKNQSAQVTPLAAVGKEASGADASSMRATLTKSTQTKEVAGFPCTVHDVSLSAPFTPNGKAGAGLQFELLMAGTVCLSTAVPGLADYQAFHKAAAESGFIFGDPRSAKSPAGAAQARAYAELTQRMAEGGMPLETRIMISATGEGPLASAMAKLANSEINTIVTSVVSGEVPGEKFEIPPGYKMEPPK